MGGCLALEFAADYPHLVHRLVVEAAAYRPSEEGEEIARQWVALIIKRKWLQFYLNLLNHTYSRRHKYWHDLLYLMLAPALAAGPASPDDIIRSLEAMRAFDIGGRLSHIRAPTLVIGGENDVFFPGELIRETARRIPDCRLKLFNHSGHGVTVERQRACEQAILSFLDGDEASNIAPRPEPASSRCGHESASA